MPRDQRVQLIARLLQDHTIHLADRVAGLLVALYAQPVSRLPRIRLDDVDITTDPPTITVHGTHIDLDPDTAHLLGDLASRADDAQQWQFPGRHRGQPVAANSLIGRLHTLGVTCDARVGAFHDLATQIASPVLADLIGYNPYFLAERAAALGTPWQTYAALARSTAAGRPRPRR